MGNDLRLGSRKCSSWVWCHTLGLAHQRRRMPSLTLTVTTLIDSPHLLPPRQPERQPQQQQHCSSSNLRDRVERTAGCRCQSLTVRPHQVIPEWWQRFSSSLCGGKYRCLYSIDKSHKLLVILLVRRYIGSTRRRRNIVFISLLRLRCYLPTSPLVTLRREVVSMSIDSNVGSTGSMILQCYFLHN